MFSPCVRPYCYSANQQYQSCLPGDIQIGYSEFKSVTSFATSFELRTVKGNDPVYLNLSTNWANVTVSGEGTVIFNSPDSFQFPNINLVLAGVAAYFTNRILTMNTLTLKDSVSLSDHSIYANYLYLDASTYSIYDPEKIDSQSTIFLCEPNVDTITYTEEGIIYGAQLVTHQLTAIFAAPSISVFSNVTEYPIPLDLAFATNHYTYVRRLTFHSCQLPNVYVSHGDSTLATNDLTVKSTKSTGSVVLTGTVLPWYCLGNGCTDDYAWAPANLEQTKSRFVVIDDAELVVNLDQLTQNQPVFWGVDGVVSITFTGEAITFRSFTLTAVSATIKSNTLLTADSMSIINSTINYKAISTRSLETDDFDLVLAHNLTALTYIAETATATFVDDGVLFNDIFFNESTLTLIVQNLTLGRNTANNLTQLVITTPYLFFTCDWESGTDATDAIIDTLPVVVHGPAVEVGTSKQTNAPFLGCGPFCVKTTVATCPSESIRIDDSDLYEVVTEYVSPVVYLASDSVVPADSFLDLPGNLTFIGVSAKAELLIRNIPEFQRPGYLEWNLEATINFSALRLECGILKAKNINFVNLSFLADSMIHATNKIYTNFQSALSPYRFQPIPVIEIFDRIDAIDVSSDSTIRICESSDWAILRVIDRVILNGNANFTLRKAVFPPLKSLVQIDFTPWNNISLYFVGRWGSSNKWLQIALMDHALVNVTGNHHNDFTVIQDEGMVNITMSPTPKPQYLPGIYYTLPPPKFEFGTFVFTNLIYIMITFLSCGFLIFFCRSRQLKDTPLVLVEEDPDWPRDHWNKIRSQIDPHPIYGVMHFRANGDLKGINYDYYHKSEVFPSEPDLRNEANTRRSNEMKRLKELDNKNVLYIMQEMSSSSLESLPDFSSLSETDTDD